MNGYPPLAERMRPTKLENYIGQQHLVGEKAVLRRMIENGAISSIILWGPPGVGKTTLARIIANQLNRPFYILSAVSSGVKDVREVLDKAKNSRFFNSPTPLLFIDEIHRFSKSQQDSLLGAVEQGIVTLLAPPPKTLHSRLLPRYCRVAKYMCSSRSKMTTCSNWCIMFLKTT
jgi:putative ATPase